MSSIIGRDLRPWDKVPKKIKIKNKITNQIKKSHKQREREREREERRERIRKRKESKTHLCWVTLGFTYLVSVQMHI